LKRANKTLIVILGPTASGKTNIAIEVAKKFSTEIISADSRQFYHEIPIGTASPTKEQLTEIPHHFVGQLSISEDYNVSKFEKEVLLLLDQKFKIYDLMVMVGGSGLYIDAVCEGIDELPDPDEDLRKQLNILYQENGLSALQQRLQKLDPEYYNEVDLNNPKRLIRAIEVCLQTGKKFSEQRKRKPKVRSFNMIKIGLELPRQKLIERINNRTGQMMNNGFLEEAKTVVHLKERNALNTVGYKELFNYLDGKSDLETAVEKIKTNTRRYAKRQMTWFRRDASIHWFSSENVLDIIHFIENKLGIQD